MTDQSTLVFKGAKCLSLLQQLWPLEQHFTGSFHVLSFPNEGGYGLFIKSKPIKMESAFRDDAAIKLFVRLVIDSPIEVRRLSDNSVVAMVKFNIDAERWELIC